MPKPPSELGDLADYLPPIDGRLPKRERTRAQLLEAAVHVLAVRGVDATIQEIADRARVTPATFYNHFKTKEEVLGATAVWIGIGLCERIAASYASVDDGAARMAIGNRRYIQLAAERPGWATLFLDLGATAPALYDKIDRYVVADLRMGIRQKRFRIASEPAALDLIHGTVSRAMRSVVAGTAPAHHDIAVAATVLRGLGMAFDDALSVARSPLPPLPPPRSSNSSR